MASEAFELFEIARIEELVVREVGRELPEDQYMIPYGDYTFRFLLRPTVK